MGRLVKLGNPIRLSLQLSDEDSAAYPQATLKNALGVDLAGSPVNVSHVDGGLYSDSSINMPATELVSVQWRVFSDAGHTVRHPCHPDTLLDIFDRDFYGESIDSLLSGSLPGESLSGTIEDDGELIGLLDDSEIQLIGLLEDNESLIGLIEDPDTLIGSIDGGEELIGFIDC